MRPIVLLCLWFFGSVNAWAGPEEASAKLTAKAEAKASNDELTAAFKLVSKALMKHPHNTDALYLRATVLQNISFKVSDELAQQLMLMARHDAELLYTLEPDRVRSAIIKDSLNPQHSLSIAQAACRDADAFARAEHFFQRNDMVNALAAYDESLAVCPNDTELWVYSGDALWAEHDRAGAIARYEKAIELVPCNWQAHRFMADVRTNSGEPALVWESLTQAVACNPGYAAAWKSLESEQGARSMDFFQASVSLPVATATPDASLDERATAWAIGRSLAETPTLASETAALRKAVQVYRANPDDAKNIDRPFWQHMDEADQAGQLGEALLVQVFNNDTISFFVDHSQDHQTQILDYVRTLVAPYPQAIKAPAEPPEPDAPDPAAP